MISPAALRDAVRLWRLPHPEAINAVLKVVGEGQHYTIRGAQHHRLGEHRVVVKGNTVISARRETTKSKGGSPHET